MFFVVFVTRYLDLFWHFVSLYNTFAKIFFITATGYTLYLVRYVVGFLLSRSSRWYAGSSMSLLTTRKRTSSVSSSSSSLASFLRLFSITNCPSLRFSGPFPSTSSPSPSCRSSICSRPPARCASRASPLSVHPLTLTIRLRQLRLTTSAPSVCIVACMSSTGSTATLPKTTSM